MPRFYLSPSDCNRDPLELSGQEAHHALHVLRVQAGDTVSVLDGEGREIRGQVVACARDRLRLNRLEERREPVPAARVTLYQAIPKGKIIESIIQKATELGVARVVPVLSERVVTRLDPAEAEDRGNKLQAVAIEAIKQCGALWLPRVEAPRALPKLLAQPDSVELAMVGSLQTGSLHPREVLRAFHDRNQRLPRTIAVWVGPEGDFTQAELNQIQAGGALPISLGPLVLRSETAALYCLSFLRYELQPSASAPWR